MSRGRWLSGTLVVGGSVVGSISQGASGDWFAYGCLNDWEDTPLRSFPDEARAKRAVEDWVEENT